MTSSRAVIVPVVGHLVATERTAATLDTTRPD